MYFLRRINLGINTYERSACWSLNHNRIIVAASSLDLLLVWRILSSYHTHCHYCIIILVKTAHSSCCGTLSYRHRRRQSYCHRRSSSLQSQHVVAITVIATVYCHLVIMNPAMNSLLAEKQAKQSPTSGDRWRSIPKFKININKHK